MNAGRGLSFVLVLWVASIAACTSAPVATPTMAVLPTAVLPTYTVQRGEVIHTVTFQAQVTALDAQPLYFSEAGTIREFFVQAGETITNGQVLAVLNTAKAQQELTKIQGELGPLEAANARVLRKAELGLQIAQLTLDLYTQEGRSATEIQIAQLQLELAQINYDEIALDPALQTRRERLLQLTETISNSQLISPVDSRVVQILTISGKTVDAETPILTFGDPAAIELTARLDTETLQWLKVGQSVSISPGKEALPPVSGTISALPAPFGSAPDDLVHLTFAGGVFGAGVIPAEVGFALGNLVQVTVEVERKPGALWLPPEAINRVADRTWVIVQDGETRRRIDIQLGIVTSGRVEILADLAEGQVVIGP